MAVIDIGDAAIDRGTLTDINVTRVAVANSANDTGTIDTVEIWMFSNGSNVEVATFIDEGSNVLSTRDSEAIGSVTSGSKQTFSGLDMDVETGDYIGIYGTAGAIEYATSGEGGDGVWFKSGDQIPCTSETFSLSSGRTISLYGTGTTVAGWTGKVMGVTNPGKIYGVDVANISKVMGVS